MFDLSKELEKNPKHIATLFNGIARRYDRTNSLLSLGLNTLWSRKAARLLAEYNPADFIDLCGGTGEITRRLNQKFLLKRAVIVDFSAGMLEIAKQNLPHVETIEADVCSIPLQSETFDAAAIAYGLRNIQDRTAALSEAFRLLRPGGCLAILELTRPNNRILRLGHQLYLKLAVPMIGKLTTRKKSAYSYLSQSIESFIAPEAIESELAEAGFTAIEAAPLNGGIATLFKASRP